MMNAFTYCKNKVHGFFNRVFKEQAGGAELIATLVIVGIVLALALIFRDNLTTLVANLWNSLVKPGQAAAGSQPTINEWQ